MPVQSNPRKLYQSGGTIVVSLPTDIRDEMDIGKGDRVVITADGQSATVEPVEWTVSDS